MEIKESLLLGILVESFFYFYFVLFCFEKVEPFWLPLFGIGNRV